VWHWRPELARRQVDDLALGSDEKPVGFVFVPDEHRLPARALATQQVERRLARHIAVTRERIAAAGRHAAAVRLLEQLRLEGTGDCLADLPQVARVTRAL